MTGGEVEIVLGGHSFAGKYQTVRNIKGKTSVGLLQGGGGGGATWSPITVALCIFMLRLMHALSLTAFSLTLS